MDCNRNWRFSDRRRRLNLDERGAAVESEAAHRVSIINVYRCDDYAWLSADTAAVLPECPTVASCKVMPLVQMPAVVACRGVNAFSSILFVAILTRPCDFDFLLGEMPQLCSYASAGVEEWKTRGIVAADAPTDKHEAVLVGWSHAQGRIVGREYTREDTDDHSFVVSDIEHVSIAPGDASLRGLPDPRTQRDMERLARAQMKLMREKTPENVTGGKLIALRIGRSRIQSEEICDLDAPASAATVMRFTPSSVVRARLASPMGV